MSQIENMISSGELPYGAKLPAERDMALKMNVSRGTVKKAYAELANDGVVGIVWGSGVYVLKQNDESRGPWHELGEAFFDALADKNLTPKEAWEYAEIKHSRKFRLGNVRLALIHASSECLSVLSRQLASFKGIKINAYLIEDISKFKEPALVFSEFDMILVTEESSAHVLSLLPEPWPSILPISIVTSKETQIDFIKIMNFEKSGLISASRAFRDVVNEYMETKGYRYGEKDHIIDKWTDRDEFEAFVADKRHLVMPPLYSLELQPEVYEALFDFLRRGGDVVIFNPVIERGSILHIEERIMGFLYGG